MAGTFKFELVTPERILLSQDVEQVLVPGSEGDFTVFEGHAPVITTLRPGVLTAKLPDGDKVIFVRSGFAEVTQDSLTILVERAFDVAELKQDEVASELEAAQNAIQDDADDEALRHANRAIEELKALQQGGTA